ncbi:hypothetical protein GUJ93_ZPchr0010g10301 [Zizania palustris]|uniref:Uncharacterized protein n=1 Tax=Zizania palustris TaxID=103762 RepID=A0A8J5SZ98_ZIZPA|nr:hypothetical protein GUJ93_ZPchr0010g10301 [Zizania palustris]
MPVMPRAGRSHARDHTCACTPTALSHVRVLPPLEQSASTQGHVLGCAKRHAPLTLSLRQPEQPRGCCFLEIASVACCLPAWPTESNSGHLLRRTEEHLQVRKKTSGERSQQKPKKGAGTGI